MNSVDDLWMVRTNSELSLELRTPVITAIGDAVSGEGLHYNLVRNGLWSVVIPL